MPAGARVWSNDLYEADARQPDPRRHTADPGAAAAQRDSFEELPDEFDDEEIDEDTAWTKDDEARWGAHFTVAGRRVDDDEGEDDDDDDDMDQDNGDADPWEQLEAGRVGVKDTEPSEPPRRVAAPGSAVGGQRRGAAPADVDAFLASDEDEDEEALSDGGDEDEEGDDGGGDDQRHALMLRAAGVGEHTRKRKLAKVRALCRRRTAHARF
jgi:U3 small nucleolar RNA-associated protein 14